MVSAKIGGKTFDRLENYADEEEISRSQAVDRMVKQGLDVEESDMRLVPVKSDGGTIVEEKLDEHGKEVKRTRERQEELEEQFNSREQKQTQTQSLIELQTLLIAAGFLFVAAELSIGLPDLLVIFGGLLILAVSTGFGLRRYGYV